jgi:urease accessory protein UreF
MRVRTDGREAHENREARVQAGRSLARPLGRLQRQKMRDTKWKKRRRERERERELAISSSLLFSSVAHSFAQFVVFLSLLCSQIIILKFILFCRFHFLGFSFPLGFAAIATEHAF